MPIPQVDLTIKHAIIDILTSFVTECEGNDSVVELLGKVYCKYGLGNPDVSALKSMICKAEDVVMTTQNMFLHMEPTADKKVLPFVTLKSSDKWLHFSIYVLLAILDHDSNLQTLAFRFETDEGDRNSESGMGAHDFCHVQPCQHINKHIRHVTPEWMPVSQPSIPLDADDQISLVLCMLVSLYGGREVVKRLSATGTGSL